MAALYGQILKELGLLSIGDVVLATPLPPALEYFAGARYSALEVKGGDAWPDRLQL